MNPAHYQLRVRPDDGALMLVLAKPGQPLRRIRDMTTELLWCLCADVSAAEVAVGEAIERNVIFADGMECLVTVKLSALPHRERDDSSPLTNAEAK